MSFSKVENNSKILLLDGYYYGDVSENNPDYPNIYLLYRNGIFLNRNSFALSDAKSGNVDLTVFEQQKKNKGFWGLYRINGNNIEIQSWIPTQSNCVEVLTEKGLITSDTTFKITSWESSRDEKVRNVNASFKFVPYTPKPDSTVTFFH